MQPGTGYEEAERMRGTHWEIQWWTFGSVTSDGGCT